MKPDSWIRRFASVCIARPLNAIGVTRLQLIATRLLLGVLAALLLAVGPAWFSMAAALFLVMILLERSDSGLASFTKQASPPSDRHALIYGSLSNALVFAGLGVGMRDSEYGLTAIAMGLLAAFGVTALPWLVKRLEIIDGARSPEFDGIAGLEPEDVLLLAPVALWAGWAEGVLLVTAFGAGTFACALYLTHYRKFKSN